MKKKISLITLIGILVFHAINNYIWLSKNTFPCEGDEPAHLYISLYYRNLILHPFPNFQGRLYKILEWQWPPFHHIFSAILSLISGSSYTGLVMINIVYFMMLLIGVYFIGKKIYCREAGLISMLILSFYPFIYGYSRIFMLDFPLAVITTISICLLLYTQNFSNRKFSILFGISVGIGMLIKWNFIIFIAGPVLYIAGRAIYKSIKKEISSWRLAVNILSALLPAVIISAFWYLWSNGRHLKQILSLWHIARSVPQDEIRPEANSFWESKYLWYLVDVINHQISFFYFMVFLFILPVFVGKSRVKNKLIFILWIVVPYIFLSRLSFKLPRFLLPILPAVAVISGVGILSIKYLRVKKVIIGVLLLMGIIMYFFLSYTDIFLNHNFTFSRPFHYIKLFPTPLVIDIYGKDRVITAGGIPVKHWRLKELISCVRRYYTQSFYPPLFVGIISEITTFYRGELLRYANAIYFQDFSDGIKFFNIGPYIAPRIVRTFFKNFRLFDVVILVSKKSKSPDINRITEGLDLSCEQKNALQQFIVQIDDLYDITEEIPLPDDFVAKVYVRKIPCLQNKGWRIFFHNGILKIFHHNVKITQGKGFLSWLFIDKDTYISTDDALWQKEVITENRLMVQSEWPDKNVACQVEIEVINPQKIKIDQYLGTDAYLNCKEITAGVFLSDYYRYLKETKGVKKLRLEKIFPLEEEICELVPLSKEGPRLKISVIVKDTPVNIPIAGMIEYHPFIGSNSGGKVVNFTSGIHKMLEITIEVKDVYPPSLRPK